MYTVCILVLRQKEVKDLQTLLPRAQYKTRTVVTRDPGSACNVALGEESGADPAARAGATQLDPRTHGEDSVTHRLLV